MAHWTLSGTIRVSWYQKGKTNLDLLEQEIVSGSGISWAIRKSAPHPRQITTPESLPAPTNSIKALKANTRTHNCLRLYGFCPGQPTWAGTGTNTYRGHQLSLICFFHLIWSMASSLFNPGTWQSFSTICVWVLFDLPLGTTMQQSPHWLQLDAPNSPPKLPLPFQRSPHLIHPSLDWLHSPSKMATGSNQPFLHITHQTQTDWHTLVGGLA